MTDESCLFCKIAAGKIPATIVYEDERALAFQDIHPQAPVHLLVIPRQHIPDVDHVTDADRELVGHLFRVAARLAADRGFAADGYKVLVNNGSGAGQVVFHLHLHVLSGRRFSHVPV
jgi:histidine triad (HIT) family protein